ncbi:hypothetical protein [Holospora curviuscula]|nr:hypothetical protein [Holospora curviuscula]
MSASFNGNGASHYSLSANKTFIPKNKKTVSTQKKSQHFWLAEVSVCL